MKHILKNWKTSLAGLASIIIAGLTHTGKITPETGAALLSVAGGLGFAAAKDGNVTGTPQ
jgi:hypothetical protein